MHDDCALTLFVLQSPPELIEMALKYYDEVALPKLVCVIIQNKEFYDKARGHLPVGNCFMRL